MSCMILASWEYGGDAAAYHAAAPQTGDEWRRQWCDHCRPLADNRETAVLLLLKTYLEIIALRKGPGAVPASWLVVYASVGLLAIAWVVQVLLLDNIGDGRLWPAFGGYLLALSFYSLVMSIFGVARRIKQALSAIIACGSIIAVIAVAEYTLLSPLLGQGVAGALSTLIWYWSVPVKGHIIASAIGQHWFVGVTIAIAAFILRIGVETAFAPQV